MMARGAHGEFWQQWPATGSEGEEVSDGNPPSRLEGLPVYLCERASLH